MCNTSAVPPELAASDFKMSKNTPPYSGGLEGTRPSASRFYSSSENLSTRHGGHGWDFFQNVTNFSVGLGGLVFRATPM
jgi:hypothetical protein